MFQASTAILKHRRVTAFGFFCIAIAICGVIANSDSFEHIAEFGWAKHEWIRGFLELPQLLKIPATEGCVGTIDAIKTTAGSERIMPRKTSRCSGMLP